MPEELDSQGEFAFNDTENGAYSVDEPRTRRKWLAEEDEKLRLLVSYWGDQCGKNSHWDKISSNFDNRTPKDCRKRWFYSLDPKLKRGRWTQNEDKTLMEAYQRLGPAWQRISQLIPGRTDDQCSKRYNDVLDPSISDRLRPWSSDEDVKLAELVQSFGPKWQKISREMNGRTGLTCRNRWRKLTRDSTTAHERPDTQLDAVESSNTGNNGSRAYEQKTTVGPSQLMGPNENLSINQALESAATYSVTLESDEPGHPPPMHNAISAESTKTLIEEAQQRNLKVVIHKHMYVPWAPQHMRSSDYHRTHKRPRYMVQAPDDEIDSSVPFPAPPDEEESFAPGVMQLDERVPDESDLFRQDFDPSLYLAFNPS